MYLTHALRAILRTAVATGDALWKYVSLLLSGTPPTQTFIADASVNANVLTLNGDVRPSNLNPYVEGYYSNYFDGSGDWLAYSGGTTTTLSGDFTLECWVYVTSFPTNQPIICIGDDYSLGALFYIETTGKLGLFANNVQILLSAAAITTNNWNHVAYVRSGATTTAYINGVARGTGTSSSQWSGATTHIGREVYNTGTGILLSGYLSNLRLVKGTAVYTAAFTPPTAPLTAISGTSLLTCQSNRFIDNSANNFAITRTGDVAVRGFVPFTPPTTVNVNTLYSTYFDGTGDYLVVSNNANLSLGADNFTIEMWVMLTSSSGTLVNYSNGQSVTSNFGWEYYQTSATSIQFSVMQGSSQYISSATGLVANAWNHVAGVRNGTSLKIYINGVAGATVGNLTGVTVSDPANASVNICSYLNGSYYTAGYISNFRIVKGTAVYTANFTPPTSPLTAISGTSLLTCQNATIIDNSTNALAITSFGQAQPVDVSPFTQVTTPVTATYLGSGYFDGTGDTINLPTSTALLGVGNYTVEFWVNLPAAPTGGAYFTVFAWGSSGSVLRCFLLNETVTKLGVWIGTTNVVLYPTSAMVGQWAHIALVRSGTTLTAYINGVSVATASDATNYNTGQLYVASQAATSFLTGYISNFHIVVGTAVYTANFAPPATPLTAVANTSLLTLQTDQPAANKQFVDNSGNNLVITQAGNATQGSFSPYGANWSNYFDGSGDYLTVPTNAAFGYGTGDFTIEFWMYPSNVASDQTVFSNLSSASSVNPHFYILGGSNVLRYYTNSADRLSSAALSNNTWYHIALTRASGSTKLFVNGVQAGSAYADSNDYGASAPAGIGTYWSGGSPVTTLTFVGSITNVRTVKGTAVYTANFTPPTAPLTPIAGTTLLTCQSPSLVDNSINGFAITRNGDVSVQRFSPFSPVIQAPVSYSTYFDGSGDYLSIATSTAFGFGTGDFTIEFWAYSTSTARQDWVDISDGTNRVLFYYTGSAVTFYGNGVTAITGAALVTNAWVHYALVKSSGSTKLYVNGTQAGSTYATNQNYGTTAAVSIGKDMFGSTYITGNLSNFRIVKGTAVYTANFTPPTAPLTAIANTSLLTCQSPTIVDNSSNAFALTGFGNVIQKPFHPFGTTSYSQYFGGNGNYLTVPASSGFAFGTSDFTVEGWVYVTGHSGSGANGIFQQGTTSFPLTTTNSVAFGTVSSGQVWQIYAKNTNANSSVAWAFNTWYHFAVVRNSNTTSLYINGTSVITVASDNTDYTGNYFGIGSIYGTGYCQLGYISNLRVVKGTAVYTANFTPPTAPLTAISGTSLLTCQNLTAIDNSSNAFTITKNGDVSGSLSNPFPANAYTTTTTGTAYTPALYGGSAYFDGTGDYLTAPNNGAFDFSTGDFTVEAWVYTNGTQSQYANIVCQGSTAANTWYLSFGTSNTVTFSNFSTNFLVSSSGVANNTWTHVAVSRSGTSLKMFLNGVQTASATNSSTLGATATLFVGFNNGASYFNGYMADLRITKGQALYTGGFVPPIAPLQAVKNTVLLLNMDKSGITDSSRCVDLETVGDAKIRYESPYSGSYYSNYFADTSSYFSYAPASSDAFGTGDFTVECWLNPTSTTAVNISIASATTSTWQFLTYGSQLYWQENGGNLGGAGYGTIASNVWSHVAVSRAGTTLRMFINGVQVYSVTNSYNYSVSPSARSVGPYNGGSAPAYISNFRIVKGTAVYTAAFTPSTTPLTAVAGTSLLTCQSKSFVDNSSNNFTITRNGDVAVRSLNPFQANITNSSMYFDGSGDYLVSTNTPALYLGTSNFTIEFWVYGLNFSAGPNIIRGTAQYSIGILGSASSLIYYISGNGTTWNIASGVSMGSIVSSCWNHVALVRNGSTFTPYINGVAGTTTTSAVAIAQTNGFYVGAEASGPGAGPFQGYVADLRVTNGAARYTTNFTPPTAPLPTS